MIDVNRGVEIRKERASGIKVYMYINEPGVYLNEHGKPMTEEFAERAGFEVGTHAKQKLKRERMAEFMSKLEIELELANSTEEEKILVQRGGFKVVAKPLGHADVVEIETGDRMNPDAPLNEQEAMMLLEALAPKGKK